MYLRILISALVATITCAAPGVAHAALAMPVESGSVILAFGARYDGRTHRGVDVAGDAGTQVTAPAAGTVVFAGRVPADGGGTCGAVTIELSDGMRVTVLPLAEVWVDSDAEVSLGDGVGCLARSGDDSSAPSHVHLSLRSGETYIDPTPLLTDPSAATGTGADTPGGAVGASSVGAGTSSVGVASDALGANCASRAAPTVAAPDGASVSSRAPQTASEQCSGVGASGVGLPSAAAAPARPRTSTIPVEAGLPVTSQLDFWSEPLVSGGRHSASGLTPRPVALAAILSAAIAACVPLVAGSTHRIRAVARVR